MAAAPTSAPGDEPEPFCLAVPVCNGDGHLEFARVEVWRRGEDGSLTAETRHYTLYVRSTQPGIWPMTPEEFSHAIAAARR